MSVFSIDRAMSCSYEATHPLRSIIVRVQRLHHAVRTVLFGIVHVDAGIVDERVDAAFALLLLDLGRERLDGGRVGDVELDGVKGVGIFGLWQVRSGSRCEVERVWGLGGREELHNPESDSAVLARARLYYCQLGAHRWRSRHGRVRDRRTAPVTMTTGDMEG
jgi:hypothetical protein